MATGEREMAWFMDTYSQGHGHPVPAIVTGKPDVLGGTAGAPRRHRARRRLLPRAILDHLGWDLAGQRVAVQGFGKVGAVVARELAKRGASIVAVTDVAGGMANRDGLDVDALIEWVEDQRFLRGFPGGEQVGRDEVLTEPCDILVPAALERQITAENAGALDCGLVIEAANGPTTPEADRILAEREIPVVPDLLANAAG